MKTRFTLCLFIFCFLSFYSNAQNTSSIEEVDSLLEDYHNKGMYHEALELAIQSEQLHKEKYGEIDSLHAASLHTLGIIYGDVGNYKKAEETYLNALSIREQLFGKDHKDYAYTLNNLGLNYYNLGNIKKAEAYFSLAKDIRARVLGEEHEDYAQSLGNLAGLYWAQGNFEAAEPILVKTLHLREKIKGKEHKDYLNSLSNLASLYKNMGRLKQAESIYPEVLDLCATLHGREHPNYANALSNYALLLEDLKNYDKATELYKHAISITEKKLGKKHLNYGRYIMNLAGILLRKGAYEDALKLMHENQKIRKQTLGEKHPDYALILSNLASIYGRMGQLDKAKGLMNESLSIYKELYGEKHPQYAHALLNMSGFYSLNKDYIKTLEYLALAYEANGAESLQGKSIDEISELIPQLEQISNTQAFDIFREWQGAIHKQLNVSQNEEWLNHFYKAIQSGMLILEKYKNDFVNENDKLRMLNSSTYLTRRGLESITKMKEPALHYDETFHYSEYTKAALLSDALKSKIAMASNGLPDSLARYEIQLEETLDKVKKLFIESRDPDQKKLIRQKVNELTQQKNEFKDRIQQEFPKYYNSKYQSYTAGIKEVQAIMEDNSLVIEYVVSDTNIFAFAIQKETVHLYNFPMVQDSLRAKVTELRKSISNYHFIQSNEEKAYQLFTQTAHWMHELLLAPILKDVSGIQQLIIIPDGSLGMIPFEVFLTELPKEKTLYKELPYLLKEYKVNYNYSATLWKENLEINKFVHSNANMFAFAASYDPDLFKNEQSWTNRSSGQVKTRQSLVPLPAVKKEVEMLEEQFYGQFLYGKDANERTFKENASEYGIIHLAMHGILDKKHPILSSLAFTENVDSLEDNFLQAAEISHLDLKAQLVVLSACETGYGSYQLGEGILSLARSFMFAGVPSMVVSLWQVNDNSTAKIMQAFYANLSKGMTKSEALQQAKLAYMTSAKTLAAHPAFWAPFIQIGDNRPLAIQKKGDSNWMLFVGLGGLLLLVLGGLYLKRRSSSVA